MQNLLSNGKVSFKGGLCIDLYNQSVHENYFVTITEKIDSSNLYWLTQIRETY